MATDPHTKPRILVVDDEANIRRVLSLALRDAYDVVTADDAPPAIAMIRRGPAPDLLISDLKMPGGSGVEVLQALKEVSPDSVGILLTAFASAETAVKATRLGAVDYLTKPFDVDDIQERVARLIEAKRIAAERQAPAATSGAQEFVPAGKSRRILDVILMAARAAQSDTNVLITGESGTGKEWTAREIHRQSKRRDHPFVAVNCGAFSESLLESELFGHMKGAFTGAVETKKGLLEVADGGTLFLDEVGETSLGMQVKLLRVLQERRFRRVGGTQELEANVRFIAATNRNLDEMVRQGSFREDFYFRVNVISIRLPALRERPEDIKLLAEHFLQAFSARMARPIRAISPDALHVLEAYHWPGNVRELENVIERGVALESAGELTVDSLPPHLLEPSPSVPAAAGAVAAAAAGAGAAGIPEAGFNLEEHLQQIERMHLERALKQAGGVQVRAAELLGITFRQFRYLAKKYRLR